MIPAHDFDPQTFICRRCGVGVLAATMTGQVCKPSAPPASVYTEKELQVHRAVRRMQQ